jgi:hypothetical protein
MLCHGTVPAARATIAALPGAVWHRGLAAPTIPNDCIGVDNIELLGTAEADAAAEEIMQVKGNTDLGGTPNTPSNT